MTSHIERLRANDVGSRRGCLRLLRQHPSQEDQLAQVVRVVVGDEEDLGEPVGGAVGDPGVEIL